MNVDGMTRENVASHLQKYRLYLKKLGGYPANAKTSPEALQQVQQVWAAARVLKPLFAIASTDYCMPSCLMLRVLGFGLQPPIHVLSMAPMELMKHMFWRQHLGSWLGL